MIEIVKFKGKNTSWFKYLNLLFKEKNIYIMDNHNAALWCWMQEMDLTKKYNILHIDKHYDTMASRIDAWTENIPNDINKLSIEEYLSLEYSQPDFSEPHTIMHWDNYFPIFHRLFKKNINGYHFFTHKEGSMFDEMEPILFEYPINALFNLIDFLFEDKNYKWIVNIDLDYFFEEIDNEDKVVKFVSDDAIGLLFDKINKYKNNRILTTTIAMSPECCGGWDNSINLMNLVSKKLDIEFKI